jgi:catechol 2,3-dioxygenase-like lactoylglutathione lyase family enzyme
MSRYPCRILFTISVLSIALGNYKITRLSKKEDGMDIPIGSNWKFYHVAVVVKDMDKAKKKYGALFGAGIFRLETLMDSGTFSTYEVYGKPTKEIHKSRFNHTDVGVNKLDIEFISPIEGDSIYKTFLEKNGEDLDAETAKLVARGVPVITSVKRPTGRGFAYFDFGDCLIELVGPVKV